MNSKGSLKQVAFSGIIWNTIEKFSLTLLQFVIGVILARILSPSDFGLMGMLIIFTAIAQAFVDSGMATGLIQRKERSEIDYSTVFVFNFIVSTGFYLILFFTAPYISDFYDRPVLTGMTRVLMLQLVITSFAIVQRTRLIIRMDFKKLAKINTISVLVSGIVAIIMAYSGYGVWSLVVQEIVRAVLAVILFNWFCHWMPSLKFSKESFNALFGFGSKLLIAGVVAKIINNIYNIAIGKQFPSAELGYYTRGKSLAELTSGTISNVLKQVTFPILSSVQDDTPRLVSIYSRVIKMVAFVTFPSMVLLSLIAEPFIRVLLTEKWLPAVPILQLLCFARIFYPISVVNLNILNSVGRSDLFLKVDLSKLPVSLILLAITLPMGIKAMVIGQIVSAAVGFFFNAYMPGKLFGYGPLQQLKDLKWHMLATGLMALVVYLCLYWSYNAYLKLFVGIFSGILSFALFARLFRINEMSEISGLLTQKLKLRK